MKLNAQLMLRALRHLDQKLESPVSLVVGGGGAMLLAHQFPLSTSDIDAVPTKGLSLTELSPLIEAVAKELSLPYDWLNPYYATFAHVLPQDYGTRLVKVCSHKWLSVLALSKEDLLIMKCFAARQKDVIHARALVKMGASVTFVRSHIAELKKRRIPLADRALEFLAEIETFLDEAET